jgi:hypothetical protein
LDIEDLLKFPQINTTLFLVETVVLFDPTTWKWGLVVENMATMNDNRNWEKGRELPENLNLTQCPEC